MFKIRNLLQVSLYWCLAAVYLYAGISKLFDLKSFAVLIDAYGLLPRNLTAFMTVLLSCAEVITGIGLLFRKRWALHAVMVLTMMFISILAYGIVLGLNVDCGCFGPGDPEAEAFSSLNSALIKDLIMLFMIAVIYYCEYFTSKIKSFGGL